MVRFGVSADRVMTRSWVNVSIRIVIDRHVSPQTDRQTK